MTIYNKYYTFEYIDKTNNLNNIGETLCQLDRKDEALKLHEHALTI